MTRDEIDGLIKTVMEKEQVVGQAIADEDYARAQEDSQSCAEIIRILADELNRCEDAGTHQYLLEFLTAYYAHSKETVATLQPVSDKMRNELLQMRRSAGARSAYRNTRNQ